MAASAQRKITLTYLGDVVGVQELAAAINNTSPAHIQHVTLASGNNTISAPTGGAAATACTIIKPTANAIAIVLKGVNGDTGIRLHNTDPDTVSLDGGVTSFVLNAAAQIAGVRLMWS